MIWLNDAFVEEGPSIDPRDRGFLLGDGLFETLYVEDGRPAFLNAHSARLQGGLNELGINADIGVDFIAKVIADLAMRNNLNKGRAAARLTVTRGSGQRGLVAPPAGEQRPTRLLTITKARAPASELRLVICATRRFSRATSSRFKTLNYLDNVLARNEAAREGADEAIMLNEHGRVACASAANLFIIEDGGDIITPPVEEGVLPGVVRGVIISAALREGIAIEERPVATEELMGKTLFLTNSLIGVIGARLGDERASTVSPLLDFLQSCYAGALRNDLVAFRGDR